jgi:hypothetical protein
MTLEEVPRVARYVAPPTRMDAPPYNFEKNKWKRVMKEDLVGTVPSEVSHRGETAGKRRLRDERYQTKTSVESMELGSNT